MSGIYSPETLANIAVHRAKCADGTITLEEMRVTFDLMRGDRKTASTLSAAKKAKILVPSGDDLLDELEKM